MLLMPVRVTQAKNIEYALRVVAALKARGCRPRLVLTGPPDPHDAESMAYFRSLQALRQELGVEEEMRFVFESGSDPDEPYLIDAGVVGDLFRVSDLMFMPSHREGFAMPVLEAGLVGIPVVCTEVPAAVEIGGEDVILFDLDDAPDHLAGRILAWAERQPGASPAPPGAAGLYLAGHLSPRHRAPAPEPGGRREGSDSPRGESSDWPRQSACGCSWTMTAPWPTLPPRRTTSTLIQNWST